MSFLARGSWKRLTNSQTMREAKEHIDVGSIDLKSGILHTPQQSLTREIARRNISIGKRADLKDPTLGSETKGSP